MTGPIPPTPIPEGAALVVLGHGRKGARGLDLATKLKDVLPGAEIHGLRGRVNDAGGADVTFADVAAHIRDLFEEGRPIVGICAAGILIRALAGVLADKKNEPPVVALASDGSAAVPLLGGHRGANRMALAIAEATGGQACVTTAGDVELGLALDDPPPGWRVLNPEAAKEITTTLLMGGSVGLKIEAGEAEWVTASVAAFDDEAPVSVRVTDRIVARPGKDLVLHPAVLALGVGCERGTDPDELIALAQETLVDASLAAAAVACVVSLDLKADEDAVHALARHLGVPARFFPAAELEAETPRLANPSDVVFAEVGCHGVAEGAALAAAGSGGVLVADKRKSSRATCAVARAPGLIDPLKMGRARGKLTVVGIGPGAHEWRTPEATKALTQASDVVGYRLYLDLVKDLLAGTRLHSSDMGAEEERVRKALDLAAEGRDVALVSSGDAGIYALAALVYELLEREDRAGWNRVAVSVTPGITAMQAAAARIGAPLGHDFCAISLSDLLTPWDDIERRLQAAAAGDFVVALYNPVSKRRREQLIKARDILLSTRSRQTPVILARNLGREGEAVSVIGLGELKPDRVDMLTLVLVGSSRSRRLGSGANARVYTPRGYGDKLEASKEESP